MKCNKHFLKKNVQKDFPLKISSANMTKSTRTADLVTFTEQVLNRLLHFCVVKENEKKDNTIVNNIKSP